jgi:lysozyme family protein
MNFDEAFDRLIGHEGGYCFSPSDPGGETMWGVTAAVARTNGYTGPMKALPRDTAKSIYRRKYWDAIQAEKLPGALRFDVFDAAVNSGVSQAVKWLQRIAGVGDDGVIGPMTLSAAMKLDGTAAAAAYNGVRLDFMTSLPTWAAFGRGWARRIASNLQALKG